jgi:hypothetical protein
MCPSTEAFHWTRDASSTFHNRFLYSGSCRYFLFGTCSTLVSIKILSFSCLSDNMEFWQWRTDYYVSHHQQRKIQTLGKSSTSATCFISLLSTRSNSIHLHFFKEQNPNKFLYSNMNPFFSFRFDVESFCFVSFPKKVWVSLLGGSRKTWSLLFSCPIHIQQIHSWKPTSEIAEFDKFLWYRRLLSDLNFLLFLRILCLVFSIYLFAHKNQTVH